jgi:hypothetical protein
MKEVLRRWVQRFFYTEKRILLKLDSARTWEKKARKDHRKR